MDPQLPLKPLLRRQILRLYQPFRPGRLWATTRLPLNILLFQFFIDDIPVCNEKILFMYECAFFADKASPEEVYEALQNKLVLMESWARLNRISFGIHKCFHLLHKVRAKASFTFVGEPIRYKNEVTYPTVSLRSPARIGLPWSIKLHLKYLGNPIPQKSHILRHLRYPGLKIPARILRSLFQGWIGGLMWFSLPIFSGTADQKVETSFRFSLRALTGFLTKCSNSVIYAAANTQPSFHFRVAAGYRGIGRMLALPNLTQYVAASGHGLIRNPRTLLRR